MRLGRVILRKGMGNWISGSFCVLFCTSCYVAIHPRVPLSSKGQYDSSMLLFDIVQWENSSFTSILWFFLFLRLRIKASPESHYESKLVRTPLYFTIWGLYRFSWYEKSCSGLIWNSSVTSLFDSSSGLISKIASSATLLPLFKWGIHKILTIVVLTRSPQLPIYLFIHDFCLSVIIFNMICTCMVIGHLFVI